MFSDTSDTLEVNNTDRKHYAYFRLESLREQVEKLLKEASKLRNLDRQTATSDSLKRQIQGKIENEGACKPRKPPRPPPREPKVGHTSSSEDPIYNNLYDDHVNDSRKLDLLRYKYVKIENEMTNLTELIKREVNYSSSNDYYQASSKTQQTGEYIDTLRVVRGCPQRVHRGEDQGKILRETQNGGVNENSFCPYYFSDSNNDSYYSVAPRETVNVEILHKQLIEALRLIQVTIESSEKPSPIPNVSKYNDFSNRVPIPAPRKHTKKINKLGNKPQNFEEKKIKYYKRAPIPIPRRNLQSLSRVQIQGNFSEEIKEEKNKCLNESAYSNTGRTGQNNKEKLLNDDIYILKEDDPYYCSIPMTGLVTDDELEKLQREAVILNNSSKELRQKNEQKEKQAEKSQIDSEFLKEMLRQSLAENDSLKMSLQQAKDDLERKMVLSNIPDELQAKKDIDKMFQRMKTLEKESKEREEQFRKAKRNFAEILTNCTVKTKELLTENASLIERCSMQQTVLSDILSMTAKTNGYKACFKKIEGQFGFSCTPKNGRIFLGESNIILREIKTQHLVNTEEYTQCVSENDFIIMVENIDVSSYDKKKFDDLIQVGFREKELLSMTLCKARSKPSEELEVELRNVPAMKEGEISLAMVFRNKTNCMNEENSVIKCYDIIEKIGEKSVSSYLNDALKHMNKKGNKTKIRRYFDIQS